MYLIITRSFPPEIGGMQNLMWGLTNELSKNYMIKVFADHHETHKNFDEIHGLINAQEYHGKNLIV